MEITYVPLKSLEELRIEQKIMMQFNKWSGSIFATLSD